VNRIKKAKEKVLKMNSEEDIIRFIEDNVDGLQEKKDYMLITISSYKLMTEDEHVIELIEKIEKYYLSGELDIEKEMIEAKVKYNVSENGKYPVSEFPWRKEYLIGRYGADVGIHLFNEFHKYMCSIEGTEFEDSFRICEAGVKEEEDVYEKTKSCCGFADTEIKYKGKEYKLGFNYGH